MTSISFYNSEASHNTENSREPHYKRPGALVGYTGHFPVMADEELHPDFVGSPNSKYTIRGYTGRHLTLALFASAGYHKSTMALCRIPSLSKSSRWRAPHPQ